MTKKESRWLCSIESLMLLLVILFGLRISYEMFKPKPSAILKVPGIIEAESLEIFDQSIAISSSVQQTKDFDGAWTNGSHLFFSAVVQSQWVEFKLPTSLTAGRYSVSAYLTKSFDYGIVRFLLNGKVLSSNIDLFSGGAIVPTGEIELGETNLKAKDNTLRIESVGKNEANQSPNYHFGVDGFLFEKLQ